MLLTISLPTDLVKRCKDFAKNRGATLSGTVRVAIEKVLEEKDQK